MKSRIIKIATTLFAMLLAHAASADDVPTYRLQRQGDGSRIMMLVSDESSPSPAAGDRSYDNWHSPSHSPPGSTRLTGTASFNGNEIGDDLILNNWQPSIVNDLGFSLWNSSTTGTMTVYWLRIKFYDSSLNLLAVDEASYSGATLNPGGRARVFSDDGFFAGYGYQTRSSMYMSMEFYRATGVDPVELGALMGGPITFGDSSQYIRNMTTGQLIDLGADPQTNMGFFIDTVPVPTPSAASLLAVSSLAAIRRRR
jgi:hypothetical protein